MELEITIRIESFGYYIWWPALQLVDFQPKGKNKYYYIDSLSEKNNTKEEALKIADKHYNNYVKELETIEKADKLLKLENSGITDSWVE